MLVWSMFDEKIYAERTIRAGAMGYICKQEPIENVIEAIRHVLQGNMYLSPHMTNNLLRRLGGGELERDPIAGLSNREIEVFQMLGRGMTTKAIAKKLGVSPKTIEAHRERIKTKLNLQQRLRIELPSRAMGAGKRVRTGRDCRTDFQPVATGWKPVSNDRANWESLMTGWKPVLRGKAVLRLRIEASASFSRSIWFASRSIASAAEAKSPLRPIRSTHSTTSKVECEPR